MKVHNNQSGNDSANNKKYFDSIGRLELLERVDEEYSRFMDPRTGGLREDIETIHRDCPACDSKNANLVFVKHGFQHYLCADCGMIYVSPMLADEELDKVYTDSHIYRSVLKVMDTDLQKKFDKPKFIEGIRKLTKYNRGVGKILDVGCMMGNFIEIAQNAGWIATGIELTKAALEKCREKGLNVIDQKLSRSLFPPNTFDAITFWDVLEHIANPGDTLETANFIMKSGGVLLILVPNKDSLAARVLQEKCNMFNGCQHINIFSYGSLKLLLEKKGFTILEKKTMISEFAVLDNYLSFEHPYKGTKTKVNDLIGLINEKQLHKNMYGYKLQIIASKNSDGP